MTQVLCVFLLLCGALPAVSYEYDVTVVGTSPICLLEALHHASLGKKVLLVEASNEWGGAWKSIEACGIPHVDLGCHRLGTDPQVREFFEKYIGCAFVCLAHPTFSASAHADCKEGFYFSRGCYEMISCLKKRLEGYSNIFFKQQKLERVFVDKGLLEVRLVFEDGCLTTGKLILTPTSDIQLDNPLSSENMQEGRHPFYHLYLLLHDPTSSRFTYIEGVTSGMTRAMNLTPFLKLEEGVQLVVIQTHTEAQFQEGTRFLEAFQKKELLSPQARILSFDAYVYEQAHFNAPAVQELGGDFIEVLDTSTFWGMTRYLDKWKQAIPCLF